MVHKLLQGHLEQRSPREVAGPVEGADEEALEAHGDGGRRLHGRAVGAEPGGVAAEPHATTAGGEDPGRAVSPGGQTGLGEPRTGVVGGGRRVDAGSRAPGPRAGQALGSRSSRGPRRSSTSSQRAPPPTAWKSRRYSTSSTWQAGRYLRRLPVEVRAVSALRPLPRGGLSHRHRRHRRGVPVPGPRPDGVDRRPLAPGRCRGGAEAAGAASQRRLRCVLGLPRSARVRAEPRPAIR